MKALGWIDRLKRERGWESDYRVAKELEVGRATVSKYRNSPDSTMDDEVALRVAAALQVPAEIILLDQVKERTRSEPARAALERALKRLGGAVAGIVIAAGLAAPVPSPAKVLHDEDDGGLRIMSNRRRRRRSVLGTMASALQTLSPAPRPHAPA